MDDEDARVVTVGGMRTTRPWDPVWPSALLTTRHAPGAFKAVHRGLPLPVMMSLAKVHVRVGTPESLRSLFAAVPFADTR